MTRSELWVSVACTDRAKGMIALACDLAAQAAIIRAKLRLFVVDNCTQAAEAMVVADLGPRLANSGVSVEVAASGCRGASIATNRRRQREQLRAALAVSKYPQFIWMLDDDVRLTHLRWSGAYIEERPLHCHLAFLQEMSAQHPNLDVLVGDVSGDPPIPVSGSVVSRLSDLAANLEQMFICDPREAWLVPDAMMGRLAEHDAYYDLSLERRSPSWAHPVSWLPRGSMLSVEGALHQMIDEVEHIPRGGAFSRPILAAPGGFGQLHSKPLRGANAVFFNAERCVEHAYPSFSVRDVDTRRSDMIGAMQLAAAGAVVRGSTFSVLHQRPRQGRWPTAFELATCLVADTAGACLARATSCAGSTSWRTFLVARLHRVAEAGRALTQVATRLRQAVARAPAWAPSLAPVVDVLDWAIACYPTFDTDALALEIGAALRAHCAAGGAPDRGQQHVHETS